MQKDSGHLVKAEIFIKDLFGVVGQISPYQYHYTIAILARIGVSHSGISLCNKVS